MISNDSYKHFNNVFINLLTRQIDNINIHLNEKDINPSNSHVNELITSLRQTIFNLKEDFVIDLALHPENRMAYKKLESQIRKLDPNSFKEIQNILDEVQNEAKIKQKVIVACNAHEMDLKEYEALMIEFSGDVNKEIYDPQLYPHGLTPLRKAIGLNNQKFVMVLNELGANLNLVDNHLWTPLTYAIARNNVPIIELLVKLGANPNFYSDKISTPLKYAIKYNLFDIARLLQKLGADLNLLDNRYTPLTYAIHEDNFDGVKLLVELGAGLNVNIKNSSPPLIHAIGKKSHPMIELLVKLGADPNFYTDSAPTPLKHAIRNNLFDTIRLLQNLGADLNLFDNKSTPLNYAVHNNNFDGVKLLVELGAGLNVNIKNSLHPLIYAVNNKSTSMVELLVKLGADPNFFTPTSPLPLGQAIHIASTEMLRLLKKLGADMNLSDLNHLTPLRIALIRDDPEIIRLLHELGADLNLPNNLGRPPMTEAIMMNRPAIALALQQIGVDTDSNFRIQKDVELAHIWGVGGNIPINYQHSIISLFLEGMQSFNAMLLLQNMSKDFFLQFPEFTKSALSSQNRDIILEALATSYPKVNHSNESIVASIQSGKPFLCEAGIEGHSIAFAFCKGKMIVCNRGLGRETIACEIYDLPQEKLTPDLIAKCKAKYLEIKDFKHMLAGLKLKKEEGYRQKDQVVGNCAWASAKAALGALLRQYASSEAVGRDIYKQFTTFVRRKALIDYLTEVIPPDIELLRLISKKLPKRPEFADLKQLIDKSIN